VQSAFHQTVRAWDGSYYVPRFSADDAGRAGRVVLACVLAVGFLYCGVVAYDVLQDLRQVKLIDLRAVLYRVSVGDAVLTWLAYVCGRDLLRAALR
jgi:hypothetical protein